MSARMYEARAHCFVAFSLSSPSWFLKVAIEDKAYDTAKYDAITIGHDTTGYDTIRCNTV